MSQTRALGSCIKALILTLEFECHGENVDIYCSMDGS